MEGQFLLSFGIYNRIGNETWNVLEYFYGSRTDLPYTEYTTGHEKRGVE